MPGSNHTVAVSRPLPPNRGNLFTACLQLPRPPDSPDYPPTAIEQFFMLFVTLALIFALALLVLPEKWSRKIIKIAFCIGPKGRP